MTNFSGMTTNERLFETGLAEQFDSAVRQRDRSTMIAILAQVDVPEDVADTILANPDRYGF